MDRLDVVELLENPSLADEVVADAYCDLARTHRWLGNTAAILNRLRDGSVRSVLDLGCGQGALLQEIRRRRGVKVIGLDLRPAPASLPVPILTGNAVADPLPRADVAIAVCLVHHLSEVDIVRLIRNVSSGCGAALVTAMVVPDLPKSVSKPDQRRRRDHVDPACVYSARVEKAGGQGG
jgi:SAM-dependent methyltransferase